MARYKVEVSGTTYTYFFLKETEMATQAPRTCPICGSVTREGEQVVVVISYRGIIPNSLIHVDCMDEPRLTKPFMRRLIASYKEAKAHRKAASKWFPM